MDAPRLALIGGPQPWPFSGHVRGELCGPEASVAWVGHRGAARGPEAAWRSSRELERALVRAGPPTGDRRRVLTVLWSRLDQLAQADDLVLLLAARDAGGVALSAVGLRTIFAVREGSLRPWVSGRHPLLGPPGVPQELPGALVLDGLPGWLVAWDGRTDSPEGLSLQQAFRRSGVRG